MVKILSINGKSLPKKLEECSQLLDKNQVAQVIEAYQNLLEIYTKKSHPKEWVIITTNLGKAYRDYGPKKSKKENIEKAIYTFKKALEISKKNNLVHTWEIEYELGICFDQRVKGFPDKNIESAIQYLDSSLQFLNEMSDTKQSTKDTKKIAIVKYRLSCLYLKQLDIGKISNLDLAIDYLHSAKSFYQKNSSSSLSKENYLVKTDVFKALGDAYLAKSKDDPEALDKAVDYYKKVLSLKDKYNNLAELCADAKYKLGVVYFKKQLVWEAVRNLREAIYSYQELDDQENLAKVYERLGYVLIGRKNPTEIIHYFENSIKFYSKNKYPEKWASIQLILGTIYGEINGRKAEKNIENCKRALKCLQDSIRVYKSFLSSRTYSLNRKNLFKLSRSEIQSQIKTLHKKRLNYLSKLFDLYESEDFLGKASASTLLGLFYKDEDLNQEQSIYCFQQSLKFLKKYQSSKQYLYKEYCQRYIEVKYYLGQVFLERIAGEKKDNIEYAIQHLSEIFTQKKELSTQVTCHIKEQLGLAYFYRIIGNRSENIEQSIQYFSEVRSKRGQDINAPDWLRIVNHLANAYKVRIKGDKQENIEKAIECFESVLKSDMKVYSSDLRGMTYNNLGIIYTERIKGLREENFEKSIAYFKKALLFHIKSRFPEKWARTYNNLGTVYLQRLAGDKKKNLEKAISYCKKALSVQNHNTSPEQWAMICCNLGIAFFRRIKGNNKRNLETAIEYCKKALEIRNKNAFPEKWAATNQYLGGFYKERVLGTKEENIQLAITHFRNALEICQRELFPQRFQAINASLGGLFFEQQDWLMASDCYQKSIETLELLRSQAFDEERRQNIIADSITIYHNLVKSNIEIADYQRALINSERSRSRRLQDV